MEDIAKEHRLSHRWREPSITDPDLKTEVADTRALITKCSRTLSKLRLQFSTQGSANATEWLHRIDEVTRTNSNPKAVIGIVGSTGSGKSALVNALLDHEKVLPTNCMRACTAVVTEIMYNSSIVPYKAEIHFVDADEWKKELELSLGDLMDDDNNVSPESTKAGSEANIALAKIKAVYPDLTTHDLAQTTIDKLMAYPFIKSLGSIRSFENVDVQQFHIQLRRYIDSREKSTRRGKSSQAPHNSFEWWPLLRVVKLYVKSEVLKSGTSLVDLPGIHDSNAARAAVAQNYIKQCDALIIAAPIHRAVDDKSARTLLGSAFKNQLKMDGGISNIAFACTKSDDISLTEVNDSLELDDITEPLNRQMAHLREKMQNTADEKLMLQRSADDLRQEFDDVEQALYELELGCGRGRSISDTHNARKPNRLGKRGRSHSRIDEDVRARESVANEVDGVSTTVEIQLKASELRARRKSARHDEQQARKRLRECETSIEQSELEIERIDQKLHRESIAARNEYSKNALKTDFAAGIQELDEEAALEADPEGFDQEQHFRDYEQVARDFPVFCVSSKAYQKLRGYLKREKPINGFRSFADTEIPALQAYCSAVGSQLQLAASRSALVVLDGLLNSLRLWSGGQSEALDLTQAELDSIATFTDTQLDHLRMDLHNGIDAFFLRLSGALQSGLYDQFPAAVGSAKLAATTTAEQWGASFRAVDPAERGLYWSTYKAVVRRNGRFANSKQDYDFNEDLVRPLIRKLMHPWEKVFTRDIPSTIKDELTKFNAVLSSYHTTMIEFARDHGTNVFTLELLGRQMTVHRANISSELTHLRSEIKQTQRKANREFAHGIETAMCETYEDCAAERGTGSFARMKAIMKSGIQDNQDDMFDTSVQTVRDTLDAMILTLKLDFSLGIDKIFGSISRDSQNALSGQRQNVLKEEQKLKEQTMAIINEHESSGSPQPVPDGAQETRASADPSSFNPNRPIKIENEIGRSQSI